MLLALLGLLGAAAYLALHRMYQVDEAQNIFMVRALATHQAERYFTNALLWMLGPMSWLVGGLNESVKIFEWSRLLFLCVFLLNIFLIAINTGRKLTSFAGLAALFGAATLAPLWDYGFEIRHDNLILTCLLLMWWLGRVTPRGRLSYIGLGFLAIILPLLSVKAVAYAAPMCLAFIVFPPARHQQGRTALIASMAIGAAMAALAVVFAYISSGAAQIFMSGILEGVNSGAHAVPGNPWLALDRLPRHMPLVRDLALVAVGALVVQFCVKGKAAFTWDGLLPEALLFIGSVALLMLNPTPFPYNLVNVVPFAYLLAFRFTASIVEFDWNYRYVASALFGVLLVAHVLPFGQATQRHFAYTNERQKTLMRAAEALTDPVRDRVYDGIGMVPTRPSIGYQWYLHSLKVASFASGAIPAVSAMLAERPAAVIIRSYRTGMMPSADWQFIEARYIALAGDFWVLGGILPKGGGNYLVLHPGRYLVMRWDHGQLGSLGGLPLQLAAGNQRIDSAPDIVPAVVWVGPTLDAPPAIGEGKHRRLFINFY